MIYLNLMNAGRPSKRVLISVAMGRFMALYRRTRQVVPFVIGDLRPWTCVQFGSRILASYRAAQSVSDFWTTYQPVFRVDPKHEQICGSRFAPPALALAVKPTPKQLLSY